MKKSEIYGKNHSKVQHSMAQHSTTQHSAAQHSIAHCSAAQHNTAKRSTTQHSAPQRSTACEPNSKQSRQWSVHNSMQHTATTGLGRHASQPVVCRRSTCMRRSVGRCCFTRACSTMPQIGSTSPPIRTSSLTLQPAFVLDPLSFFFSAVDSYWCVHCSLASAGASFTYLHNSCTLNQSISISINIYPIFWRPISRQQTRVHFHRLLQTIYASCMQTVFHAIQAPVSVVVA